MHAIILQLGLQFIQHCKMHLPPNPKRKYERENVFYYTAMLQKSHADIYISTYCKPLKNFTL